MPSSCRVYFSKEARSCGAFYPPPVQANMLSACLEYEDILSDKQQPNTYSWLQARLLRRLLRIKNPGRGCSRDNAPEGGKRITAQHCRVAKGVHGIIILLPFLGECWLRTVPKALPWADLFWPSRPCLPQPSILPSLLLPFLGECWLWTILLLSIFLYGGKELWSFLSATYSL